MEGSRNDTFLQITAGPSAAVSSVLPTATRIEKLLRVSSHVLEIIMTTSKSKREELAARIKQEIQQSQKAFANAVDHATEAGKLLIEAKKGLSHGKWGEWVFFF